MIHGVCLILNEKLFFPCYAFFSVTTFAGRLFYSQVDEPSYKMDLVTPNDCYSKPFYEIIRFLF